MYKFSIFKYFLEAIFPKILDEKINLKYLWRLK